MIYRRRLEEIREEQGIKKRNISLMLGLNVDVYGQYEREYYIMPLKHLLKVGSYFKISIDYIFNFTNIKQYKNMNYDVDIKEAGMRLKEFRKENKLTQQELASNLNVVNTIISKYERGEFLIATHTLYILYVRNIIYPRIIYLGKLTNQNI